MKQKRIELICEVLDSQILDREGNEMGKVDGIALEVRRGQPPRVAFLEQGGAVPWRRLNRALGEWVKRRGVEPFRIPWCKVTDTGLNVRVDYQAAETPALKWEVWIREHIMDHIPGAR